MSDRPPADEPRPEGDAPPPDPDDALPEDEAPAPEPDDALPEEEAADDRPPDDVPPEEDAPAEDKEPVAARDDAAAAGQGADDVDDTVFAPPPFDDERVDDEAVDDVAPEDEAAHPADTAVPISDAATLATLDFTRITPVRPPPTDAEEIAEESALRRRRVAALAALAALVIGGLLLAICTRAGDDDDAANVATDRTTSSTRITTFTTFPTPSTLFLAPPTTSAFVAPTTPAPTFPPATATTVACRNSTNPACGQFRWSRDPGPNQPLTIDVRWDPVSPQAGQEVVFTVDVVDPDATPITDHPCNGMGWGFGDGPNQTCAATCPAPNQYGPWDPPARQRGQGRFEYRHVYEAPGSYTATFTFGSAGGGVCGNHPYASAGQLSVQVGVTD